jgi:predicted lipoprotein with Yx(FWY)xxD motif
MQSKLTLTGAIAALTLLAGCGGSTGGSTAGTTPTPAATGATIAVATNTKLGQILVDGAGKTVYLFVADKGTTSACYTSCAAIWPPVLTTGAPQAGSGAQSSLLGTTARTDGTTEVTYAGHPLYYFVQDQAAGDTMGQGINGFGGLWWVMSPAGAAMH